MKNRSIQIAFSFGFTMIASLGLAVFIGLKIDEFLNTTPLFIIVLSAYSIISGFVYLYKKVSGE